MESAYALASLPATSETRQLRAQSFRMRRRHVVGVRALAVAEQHPHRAAAGGVGVLEQREASRLADRNPGALGIVRPAGAGGGQLQRSEAIQRQKAERIRAADDGSVTDACFHELCGIGEHLGR